MLAGVEILLERMKTNPEEFVEGGYSKWSQVLNLSWDVLGEEERTALQDGIKSAKREHFNGEVMRVLAGDVEEEPTVAERFYKLQGNAIISSQDMITQTTQLLNDEFDKEYAKTKTSRAPRR